MEDLAVSNMMRRGKKSNVAQKRGLNRSLAAAGFADFRAQVQNQLDMRGGTLILVPAQYTSQTCPQCGHVAAENRLTQSQFCCTVCSYKNNADIVGALNIRARGVKILNSGVGVGS